MAAVGIAVGVAEEEAVPLRLHPDNESSSWLAVELKAHFELEDAEAERAAGMVTGRPNYLKTNLMLRMRRAEFPELWVSMSKKVAGVFADAADLDSTAATVQERLNFWLDEKPQPSEAPAEPPPSEPQPTELPPSEPQPTELPPSEPQKAEAPVEVPKRAEYSAEERTQRIAELEAFWQRL